VGVRSSQTTLFRTIETNIYPTEVVLLRWPCRGSRKFFLASTSEVFGKTRKNGGPRKMICNWGATSHPRWAYGCSKAIDEFLALAYHRKFGLEVVVGRFFQCGGTATGRALWNGDSPFRRSGPRRSPVVVYDDGEQIRCFAHVREVVEAVSRLMETPAAVGRVFNIGTDQPSIRSWPETQSTRDPASLEFLPTAEAYGVCRY